MKEAVMILCVNKAVRKVLRKNRLKVKLDITREPTSIYSCMRVRVCFVHNIEHTSKDSEILARLLPYLRGSRGLNNFLPPSPAAGLEVSQTWRKGLEPTWCPWTQWHQRTLSWHLLNVFEKVGGSRWGYWPVLSQTDWLYGFFKSCLGKVTTTAQRSSLQAWS